MFQIKISEFNNIMYFRLWCQYFDGAILFFQKDHEVCAFDQYKQKVNGVAPVPKSNSAKIHSVNLEL